MAANCKIKLLAAIVGAIAFMVFVAIVSPLFFNRSSETIAPATDSAGVNGNDEYKNFPDGTIIDGYPVASAVFNASGELAIFISGAPISIQNDLIPTWSEIELDANRKIHRCIFPEDTTIQGYIVRGAGFDMFSQITSFHPNGQLESFTSRTDVMIQNVPCRGSRSGVFRPINLDENGNLKHCTLAHDEMIGGISLKADQIVYMDEQGQVQDVGEVSWGMKGLEWSWPVLSIIPNRLLPFSEQIYSMAGQEREKLLTPKR